MKWDENNQHWLVSPGSRAFDLLQAAVIKHRESVVLWRDLADRISARFGLPYIESFSFYQGDGSMGKMPIVDFGVFGDAVTIEAVTSVDPKSWNKPKPADGAYPLRVRLRKQGTIHKALPEMVKGVPSYQWGISGHLAATLGEAAGIAQGLDSIFYRPGVVFLEDSSGGAIFITNASVHLADWGTALQATGATVVTAYEAMRAHKGKTMSRGKWTDQEKLAMATQFTFGDPIRGDAITVEQTDNGHGPHTGDGIPRWAVRSSGSACLEVGTRDEFVYEPSPSNRKDDWLVRHRFTDLDAALTAADNAQGWRERRMAERREASSPGEGGDV